MSFYQYWKPLKGQDGDRLNGGQELGNVHSPFTGSLSERYMPNNHTLGTISLSSSIQDSHGSTGTLPHTQRSSMLPGYHRPGVPHSSQNSVPTLDDHDDTSPSKHNHHRTEYNVGHYQSKSTNMNTHLPKTPTFRSISSLGVLTSGNATQRRIYSARSLPYEQESMPESKRSIDNSIANLSTATNIHPGIFAMQSLMMRFLNDSEKKIADFIHQPLEQPLLLDGFFAQGIDSVLDESLHTFAQISVHEASLALQALLTWVESKHVEIDPNIAKQRIDLTHRMGLKETIAALSERKWLSADYLFCRAAIEIVNILGHSSELKEDIISYLETFAFEHLKGYRSELDLIPSNSPNYVMVQDKLAQLIGSLSRIRFVVVTERIVAFLEHNSSKELVVENGVRALRYIQLRLYPMDAFEETISFIKTCSELFQEASQRVKSVYAEVFVNWFIPIAAIAEAEVNVPAWMKNIEILYHKALKMLSKPKHQPMTLPLVCSLLCVSQADFFLKYWYPFIELCSRLFKDKMMKQIALACCVRIIWVHFYRCESSQSNVVKLIEMIARQCFPQGRRHIIPTDTSLEPFIQLVHYCGVKQLEFSMKHLIYPLLLQEHSFNSLEVIAIERTIIAFRAFAKIIEDIRLGGNKPILQSSELSKWTNLDNVLSPIVNDALSSGLAKKLNIVHHLDKMDEYAGEIMRLLHSSIGIYLLKNDKYANKIPSEIMPRERMSHIELMKTLMSCMPRIFPGRLETSSLIEILTLYVVHVDKSLAICTSDTLRRIMQQCTDMRVVVIVAMLNLSVSIPYRHSLLLQTTLKLSGDLLEIWCQHVDRDFQIDSETAIDAFRQFTEDLESKCLMLLCNWLPKVRSASLRCIRLIHELWSLYREEIRKLGNMDDHSDRHTIFDIIQEQGHEIVKKNYMEESLIPNPKNEQFIPKGITLLKLAESEAALDQSMWAQCFADMLQVLYEKCPRAIGPCWVNIVDWLSEVHQFIETAVHNESSSGLGFSSFSLRQEAINDDLLYLWRNYLSFACCICPPDHASSRSMATTTTAAAVLVTKGRINSAQSLFKSVLPILKSDNTLVRSSVVVAVGRANRYVYRVLLEEIQNYTQTFMDDIKPRSQKNKKRLDRIRLDIAQIYYLTSDLLSYDTVLDDEAILRLVLDYVMETKAFLIQTSSQLAWEIHMMRYYYCRLVQKFYGPVSTQETWLKYFPPEIRASLFYFFEEWCGMGNVEAEKKRLENQMFLSMLAKSPENEREQPLRHHPEDQVRALEIAALMAMSELLKGSIYTKEKRRPGKDKPVFDIDGLFSWIEAIFCSPEDRIHKYGRSAVHLILKYNIEHVELLDRIIKQCYHTSMKVSNEYFMAIVDVFSEQNYPCDVAKLMVLILFKMADTSAYVRQTAVRLLQVLEQHYFVESFVRDYEMSLINTLPQSYQRLYLDFYCRLATLHHELSYTIFSECTERFGQLNASGQRHLLSVLLPWMSYVEFSVSREKELEEHTYIFLANFVYLTMKYDTIYPDQFEALWSDLVGRGDNAKIILYFLMHVAMKKRNPSFLSFAKRIVTYLGRSRNRKEIVNLLALEITPGSISPLIETSTKVQTFDSFIYMAPLDDLVDVVTHGVSFSVSELAFIFLTDLVLDTADELWVHLPLLLHMSFVLMDHINFSVCDHSRMMLINLIYGLLVKPNTNSTANNQSIQMIENLEKNEGHRLWKNEDRTENHVAKAPLEMIDYLFHILELFEVDQNLAQNWGELALQWGTNCPMKHIACRSLQIFSAIMPAFDKSMISDILARVVDTIADTDEEVQSFALEELATLKAMVRSLDHEQLRSFPELFWSAVAMLFTNLEYEFLYVLDLLDEIIKSLNLEDMAIQELIIHYIPLDWMPQFRGMQPLVLKGLLSRVTDKVALELLNELLNVPIDVLVDTSPGRFMFSLLALSPYLILHLNEADIDHDCYRLAKNISLAIETKSDKNGVVRVLNNYVRRRFKQTDDFVSELCSSIDNEYFPEYQSEAILFLMELVKHGAEEYWPSVFAMLRELVSFVKLNQEDDTTSWCINVIMPLTQYVSSTSKSSALEVLKKFIELMDRSEFVDLFQSSSSSSYTLLRMKPDQLNEIWGVGDPNRLVTRQNLTSVIKSCLGDVFIKRPSVIFSSHESLEPLQILDTSMYGMMLAHGPKDRPTIPHKLESSFDLDESSEQALLAAGEKGLLRPKLTDSGIRAHASRETVPIQRSGRSFTEEPGSLSKLMSNDKNHSTNDLTFNSVFRRTFSIPLKTPASTSLLTKSNEIVKVIITVQLSLTYNEVRGIENFKNKFEQDVAKALNVDLSHVSVVLIEADPLIENGFALVTFELTKDDSSSSSVKLQDLVEDVMKQFETSTSPLFQGRSTSKIMRQHKLKIYLGKTNSFFFYVHV
jgi:hypothetical protein